MRLKRRSRKLKPRVILIRFNPQLGTRAAFVD